MLYPCPYQPHPKATIAPPPASSRPHSNLQEKDFQCRTLAAEKTPLFFPLARQSNHAALPNHRQLPTRPFELPPQTVNKSNSSNKTTHIAQHVSRIRLELAPPRLRQGRSLVVRIHIQILTKPLPPPSVERKRREKGTISRKIIGTATKRRQMERMGYRRTNGFGEG